jgi:hypothetical protein
VPVLRRAIRDLLPPRLTFPVMAAVRRSRVWAGRALLWRWRLVRLAPREGSRFDVLFLGRREEAWRAWINLGLPGDVAPGPARPALRAPRTVLVSEAPLPGSLGIPWELHMVVPLGRTLDEIAATYDGELRRRLRKQQSRFRFRRVTEPAEVARINQEMLAPYAVSRHGASAYVMSDDDVLRMARRTGRLDLLLEGEAEVACHLGYEILRAGKRYWVTYLFGYPVGVFSDPRRLRDVNSANTWSALAWSLENGYDFYDMGACHARPDDGLLQWKRRRGGEPDLLRNEGFFHFRLPREDRALFLWESPLFAVEDGGLVLHLGVPAGPSDDEVVARWRELAFGGLAAVRLHWARPEGGSLLDRLREPFARQARPPPVEVALPALGSSSPPAPPRTPTP